MAYEDVKVVTISFYTFAKYCMILLSTILCVAELLIITIGSWSVTNDLKHLH